MALAMRNSPMDCLVFFARKRTDSNPPTRPPISGMYFCFYSLVIRLKAHMIVLNTRTKLPTKSPKRIASLPVSILMSSEGFLNIFLTEKSVESPALMR